MQTCVLAPDLRRFDPPSFFKADTGPAFEREERIKGPVGRPRTHPAQDESGLTGNKNSFQAEIQLRVEWRSLFSPQEESPKERKYIFQAPVMKEPTE